MNLRVTKTRSFVHALAGSLGAGAEVAIAPDWSARLEYLYDSFGRAAATMPSGARAETNFETHTLRLGLNWHLGRTEGNAPAVHVSRAATDRSRQLERPRPICADRTGLPEFNSPYQGEKSLAGSRQFGTPKERWHRRVCLWEGAEFTSIRNSCTDLASARHRCRIHQWRGTKIELPFAALECRARFRATDFRVGRRAGDHQRRS